WVSDFHALLWYRLIGGVGSALFVITAMALLARTVSPRRMGQAMGFYQSMLLLGVSFGPTVGGFSASVFHNLRAPFWAMAVLSSAVTIMCFAGSPSFRPRRMRCRPPTHNEKLRMRRSWRFYEIIRFASYVS